MSTHEFTDSINIQLKTTEFNKQILNTGPSWGAKTFDKSRPETKVMKRPGSKNTHNQALSSSRHRPVLHTASAMRSMKAGQVMSGLSINIARAEGDGIFEATLLQNSLSSQQSLGIL